MPLLRAARRLTLPLVSATTGAAAVLLMDPAHGRRRRRLVIDKLGAYVRRGGRLADRARRRAASEAYGAARHAVHRGTAAEPVPVDPRTLSARVQSILFRDPQIPKGDINVDVEREDVVVLRGQVSRPEQIEHIVEAARSVPGVGGVDNLLHTPGTEAPRHR